MLPPLEMMVLRDVSHLFKYCKRLAPEGHVSDAALYGNRVVVGARLLERIGRVVSSNHRRLGVREFILRQHALGFEIRQFFDLRRERGHVCCPEMLPCSLVLRQRSMNHETEVPRHACAALRCGACDGAAFLSR